MADEEVTMNQQIRQAALHTGNANSRMIFKNPVLMSQFLRNYTGMEIFSDVQPEDIEDVTELFHAYLGIEFETDTVKKVRTRIAKREVYVIPLVDHKSEVDYDVAFQLLRYMVVIWYDYTQKFKEHENKSFRYPLIIPVVYYEGEKKWTADMNFRERVENIEGMEEYIPEFRYKVVSCQSYTNEELTEQEDEMSFIMLMNKVQSAEGFHKFINTPEEYVKKVLGKATPEIRTIIEKVFWSLMMKVKLPVNEAQKAMSSMEEGNVGDLFANIEKMDIQAERKKTLEQKTRAEAAESRAEAAETHAKAAENRAEAAETHAKAAETVIELMARKLIETGKIQKHTKEEVVQSMETDFQLSRDKAQELVGKYW